MGLIVLFIALIIEVGFAIYCISSKSYQKKTKSFISIGLLAIFVLFTLISVIQWGFQWKLFAALLFIWAIIGGIFLLRNREDKKEYKTQKIILKTIAMVLLIIIAVTPAIVFPQYDMPETTGEFQVDTAIYTYTDDSRKETFTNTGENRRLTVEYWYPKDAKGTYPLLVFSHGAFGYKMSNESTYRELASNGYVVCSIDHTYHAMGTSDVDGNFTMIDKNFYKEVMELNSGIDEAIKYELQEKWMKIRTADMNFIIDTIIESSNENDTVYQMVDTNKLGVFGHSLGGSTAAAIGRERNDIDAVVSLDAPLLGEHIGFEEGEYVINQELYTKPLLNIYTDDVWNQLEDVPVYHSNQLFLNNPPDNVYNINFEGAKHLSVTDLPLFSPTLAYMLQGGSAEIDKSYCIETMNSIILEFFDCYIKGEGSFDFRGTY